MLRAEEEGLHERVGELVSALKSEQIYPEQLRELAGSQHASTSDKLLDIADVFEHMLALSGGSMLDGRDQEKLAQSKFAGSSYIKKQDIIVFGFDILPALRVQSMVQLAGAAKSFRLLIEARDDAVLQKQWQCVKGWRRKPGRRGYPLFCGSLPHSPRGKPDTCSKISTPTLRGCMRESPCKSKWRLHRTREKRPNTRRSGFWNTPASRAGACGTLPYSRAALPAMRYWCKMFSPGRAFRFSLRASGRCY